MSGYTAGPWRAVKRAQPIGWAEWEVAWSDAGELVCDVVYHEADARLIAAAPELLEACEMAAQTFIVSCRPAGNPDVDDAAEIRGMVATLRAAIAKATGAAP